MLRFILRPIIFTLAGVVIMTLLTSCDAVGKESIADQLAGKWATEDPIPFIIKTDYCPPYTLEEIGREDWSMEWVIKKTSDENIVDITMTVYRSGFTSTNSNCAFSTGYVPEPSPWFMEGHISGQTVTVWYGDDEIGSFDIQEKELSGDLAYGYCMIYCQEVSCELGDSIHLKKI